MRAAYGNGDAVLDGNFLAGCSSAPGETAAVSHFAKRYLRGPWLASADQKRRVSFTVETVVWALGSASAFFSAQCGTPRRLDSPSPSMHPFLESTAGAIACGGTQVW